MSDPPVEWRRGEFMVPTDRPPLLARISFAQAGIVIVMVFLAAAMARGYGVSLRSH